jgi:hypothetical protein
VVADAGGGHLVATWLNIQGESSSVAYSDSSDWGETWTTPRTLVSAGTSVYPWIAASGSKVAISLYRTSAAGTPETVPDSATWFESYLESTDGGATFSEPVEVDPSLPAKVGPICLEGIECNEGRELGDFQSLAIDNQGNADLAWVHAAGEEASEVLLTRQGSGTSTPTGPGGAAPVTADAAQTGRPAQTGAALSSCLKRARRSAARRLAAAKHREGRAKRRSVRAALRHERKAIARCRSKARRRQRE